MDRQILKITQNPKKKNTSSLISQLKRKTRRVYSSEEKVRIIIDDILLRNELIQILSAFKPIKHHISDDDKDNKR